MKIAKISLLLLVVVILTDAVVQGNEEQKVKLGDEEILEAEEEQVYELLEDEELVDVDEEIAAVQKEDEEALDVEEGKAAEEETKEKVNNVRKKKFIPQQFTVKKHQFNWSLFTSNKQFIGYFKQIPDLQNSRIELTFLNNQIKGVMEYDLSFIPFTSNKFKILEPNGQFLAKVVDSSGFIFGGDQYQIYDENDKILATMKCNYENVMNEEGEELAVLKIEDPFLGNRKWQFSLKKTSSAKKINRIVYAFLPLVRQFDTGFFGSFFTQL